jgi:hypothetical protein
VTTVKLLTQPCHNPTQSNQMYQISNPLLLEVEVVIKERYSCHRWLTDCNKVDVRGPCVISCSIYIRTLSVTIESTTNQEHKAEGHMTI